MSNLSPRQREVMQLTAEGVPLKGIASSLGIDIKTADKHRAWAYRKLGAHSMGEAVAKAVKTGAVLLSSVLLCGFTTPPKTLRLEWKYPQRPNTAFIVWEWVAEAPRAIWIYTPQEKRLGASRIILSNQPRVIGTTTNRSFTVTVVRDGKAHLFTVTAQDTVHKWDSDPATIAL